MNYHNSTNHEQKHEPNPKATQLNKALLKQVVLISRGSFEKIGSWVDVINSKRSQTTNYRSADLSIDNEIIYRSLREHTRQNLSHLFGKRFVSYVQSMDQMIPNENFSKSIDKGADIVFEQLASMAEAWSQMEVGDDRQFNRISSLNEIERNALVHEISNQNRALATAGGVASLVGLPGMLADSIWLLLIALRTVYQLSAVYGQPLTGKKGIKTAYIVIASSDLTEMQPKQSILAGLGVVSSILAGAKNNGFKQELQQKVLNNAFDNTKLSEHVVQLDKIAERFGSNLDEINLVWVKRLVSLGSLATNIHYNSILIEHVIGTAQATFAPELKVVESVDESHVER